MAVNYEGGLHVRMTEENGGTKYTVNIGARFPIETDLYKLKNGEGYSLLDAIKDFDTKNSKPQKHSVQIACNYDIKQNSEVRRKYPTLYAEVKAHDKKYTSSWYELSDEAYAEYNKYCKDDDIDYIE